MFYSVESLFVWKKYCLKNNVLYIVVSIILYWYVFIILSQSLQREKDNSMSDGTVRWRWQGLLKYKVNAVFSQQSATWSHCWGHWWQSRGAWSSWRHASVMLWSHSSIKISNTSSEHSVGWVRGPSKISSTNRYLIHHKNQTDILSGAS